MLVSQNPTTGQIIRTFKEDTSAQIEKKLALSDEAFLEWKALPFAARAQLFKELAKQLRKKNGDYAHLMALEMGKVEAYGKAEVEKCAVVCEYYADNADKFLHPEKTDVDASESYVRFDPLGIILAVMPWNFPFWQVFRFAAPSLMAGNVGLLKHASNVPQCAVSIEEAFLSAGFPAGVFQNLVISSPQVEGIIRDDRVVAVTLTGSEKAGSLVAKVAGEMIKPTVLELGGSDPFIVFDDADVMEAIRLAIVTRMQGNVGQSCIAAKRFLVHKAIYDEFTDGVVEEFRNLVVGDPLDLNTQVGPLATEQIMTDVEKQVKSSVKGGAQVLVGGERLKRDGYFYEPTVLGNVAKGMATYDEEVFGPVISLIPFETEDEAVRIANDTPYGLAASIFTTDIARATRIIPQIEAGSVFVNEQVKSDPRVPFGGIKRSGYGRELSSYGIREFVNVKNVWIK